VLLIGVLVYTALPDEASEIAQTEQGSPRSPGNSPVDLDRDNQLRLFEEVASEDSSPPCTPIVEFVAGPEAYRLDSWFMSWGAPPIGKTADLATSYSWYDEETLVELSKAGDALAIHEHGRRLIISALTGVDKVPEKSTIWDVAGDSEDSPFPQSLDEDKLSTGRDLLEEAAVRGRTYALIEIAISFAIERRARSIVGDLDPEAAEDLRVSTYVYGESVEALVPALHSGFFQSSIPDDLRANADRELDLLTERIVQERSDRGVVVTRMDEETAKTFRALSICLD